jgi:lysophospholipase L1-like esterase
VLLAIAFTPCVGNPAHAQANPDCDADDIRVTTTPSPPSAGSSWKVFLNQVEAAKSASDVDVVVLGDSIAQGWPAEALAPLQTFNMGSGGDHTQNALWRLQALDWNHLNPRYVVLLIGTNNLGTPTDKVCSIGAGIAKIADEIGARWHRAKIVSPGIIPRPDFSFRNDERLAINANLPDSKITVLRLDEELACGPKQPCENYAADLLHLSATGYNVLARAVKRAIGLGAVSNKGPSRP